MRAIRELSTSGTELGALYCAPLRTSLLLMKALRLKGYMLSGISLFLRNHSSWFEALTSNGILSLQDERGYEIK